MQYLADSDWVIDYLKNVRRVVERLNTLLPEGVGLSIASVAELYDGVLGSLNRENDERALADFLTLIEVLPLDDAVCRIFATERRQLRAAGASIGDFDLLIGATALRYDLTLLTNNRRHFERVRGLSIISV